ncbi:MAG: glycerol kinase, partial [Betaproteobacteria bacterium]|nr:glycerol kinase [Betaproteobacteria bacterium]
MSADTAYLLAIDQGTTSSRSMVFDAQGHVMAQAQKPLRQYYPQPGWVEHDPIEIWESQQQCMVQAMAQAGLKPDQIQAIGISNQRETMLLWERASGRPVHAAIVWQDRRSSGLCQHWREQGHEAMVQARTGLLLDPYFSGTKLAWLLQQEPALRSRAIKGELCFGTIDSWLIWQLTGKREHVIDRSNASRTLMMNLAGGQWDDAMLDLLDVPSAVLPRIVDSVLTSDELSPSSLGIPITGIAGDQQAALFGQAAIRPGMAKNTYGTGCFMLMHVGEQIRHSQHRLLSTCAWSGLPQQVSTAINPKGESKALRRPGAMEYALEGSVFVAGAALQWLRDELGLIDKVQDSEAIAASVKDTSGCYLVPAFTGLGAPHWDAEARGVLVGITRGTNRAHLVRAALESIAFQSAEVLQAMNADGLQALRELRVDGGASANNWLMQFQADLLGVAVNRPSI